MTSTASDASRISSDTLLGPVERDVTLVPSSARADRIERGEHARHARTRRSSAIAGLARAMLDAGDPLDLREHRRAAARLECRNASDAASPAGA